MLDTNIFSYLLKGSHGIDEKLRDSLKAGNNIVINPITYYEIKRGLIAIGATKKLEVFNEFCELFEIGKLTTEILDKSAEIYAGLRNKGKTIEDADVFIMAFSICNDYLLVTNNIKHFSDIEELDVENWV
ncbi:ribonuclease VapC1 [Clostridium oryzae]|uniref:Ribonuclease VapC1 n=1 Tax=Clostridium oryzae TaxID=1450648 RepID=A0A1V4I4N3_9CLOT|nr:ribonuclease VapC1 [Clostridium oryzae]